MLLHVTIFLSLCFRLTFYWNPFVDISHSLHFCNDLKHTECRDHTEALPLNAISFKTGLDLNYENNKHNCPDKFFFMQPERVNGASTEKSDDEPVKPLKICLGAQHLKQQKSDSSQVLRGFLNSPFYLLMHFPGKYYILPQTFQKAFSIDQTLCFLSSLNLMCML